MGTGVIYGVQVERPKTDGPMKSGLAITLSVRLPEWCVLDGAAETIFRCALQSALATAIETVTESDASKARRLEQTPMGTKT